MIDSHAGAANDQLALNRKVVASSEAGFSSRSNIIEAKTTINAVMKLSRTMRNRRASTMSASALAGSVNRNIGRLLATCTIETAIGSALRLVISQPEAVSDIAMPLRDNVVAIQITVKGVC